MRFTPLLRLVACAAAAPLFARASDIGAEVAGQVQIATYQDVLENHLYTRQGMNRNYNGAHHDLCRDSIVAQFQSFGLAVELFPFTYQGNTYYNVIATQPGVLYPEQQYVVGGHFDSVNNAGADDDASGVATVIELARVLSQYETAYTIKYCAWDVEEQGLKGSTAYVNASRSDAIRAMIQVDMIAHDAGANRQDLYGSATAADLKNALAAAYPLYGNGQSVQLNGAASFSDHHPFDQAAYPAICFVEDNYTANTCYHQPCDYVERVNYIHYGFATNLVRVIAGYLADHALAFHEGDCDNDGTADAIEIAANSALDCNGDGWLDSCQTGLDADCDGDGTPDACEIAAGAPDLDANGIPDSCQTIRHVPADYGTIQAAINASRDGDTVLVAGGTYVGAGNKDLDFAGRAIALIGESGAAATIIDCQGSGRGLYFHSGETGGSVVRGFTIRGGSITIGGGLYCIDSGPTIIDCVFTANNASQSGGGAYLFRRSHATLISCVFQGNSSPAGGGIRARLGSKPTLVNCVIAANTGASGVGIEASQTAQPTLINCTLSRNAATSAGGGALLAENAILTLRNSIVWGNTGGSSPQINAANTTRVAATRCVVQGGQAAVVGAGTVTIWQDNLITDPMLVAAASNDYRVLPGSPCIDAGDNAALPADAYDLDRDGNREEPLPSDASGSPRRRDDPATADTGLGAAPIADIGAFEFVPPCPGDVTADGDRDLTDLAVLLANFGLGFGATPQQGDIDGDADVDLSDLASLLGVFGLSCP